MAKLVRVYAEAFFELAVSQNETDRFLEDTKLVLATLKSEKELTDVLLHPKVSETEKINLLNSTFEGKLHENFAGLFDTVIIKRREAFLIAILEDIEAKILDHKGIVIATVTSATALDQMQLLKIQSKLHTMFKKQVELETVIDTTLIAGLKINVGGYAIDTSFKKQLNDIKIAMYSA